MSKTRERPKPEPVKDILRVVRIHVTNDRYTLTTHAIERQGKRQITLNEIKYVLLHGRHNKSRNRFCPSHNAWSYTIEGKNLDEEQMRMVVALDKEGMVIVTAMYLESLGRNS